VQLPHPVTEVLAQPVAEPNELAQFLRRAIGQPTGRRPFLRGEARDPHRIDGVGLGPLQVLAGEAARPQRVQQRHGEAGRAQGEPPRVSQRLGYVSVASAVEAGWRL
jgi:hypothetical protein